MYRFEPLMGKRLLQAWASLGGALQNMGYSPELPGLIHLLRPIVA